MKTLLLVGALALAAVLAGERSAQAGYPHAGFGSYWYGAPPMSPYGCDPAIFFLGYGWNPRMPPAYAYGPPAGYVSPYPPQPVDPSVMGPAPVPGDTNRTANQPTPPQKLPAPTGSEEQIWFGY